MARTPEQVAADDALTAAINAVTEAYWSPDGSLLTDYIVVGAWQSFDDEGAGTTRLGRLARDEGVPVYRQIGLLEQALIELRAYAMTGDD